MATFSDGFLIKTFGPFLFKSHMQPSSKGGKKLYIFRPGHMTNMAAMTIYGKYLIKSAPEPLG
ncbi:MAG: hypothetical protein ACH255_20845 [Candidatus Thiodiazotropha sp.]